MPCGGLNKKRWFPMNHLEEEGGVDEFEPSGMRI